MAVSGLPEPCLQHARCIASLALSMMEAVEELRDAEGNKVQVRVWPDVDSSKDT